MDDVGFSLVVVVRWRGGLAERLAAVTCELGCADGGRVPHDMGRGVHVKTKGA